MGPIPPTVENIGTFPENGVCRLCKTLRKSNAWSRTRCSFIGQWESLEVTPSHCK